MFQGPPGAPHSWRPRVNPTTQTHADQWTQDRVPSRIIPLPSSHREKSARRGEGHWCFCKILFVSHIWICSFCSTFVFALISGLFLMVGDSAQTSLHRNSFLLEKGLQAEHQSEITDSELEQQVRMKFQRVRPRRPRRPLLTELLLDTSVVQLLLVVPAVPSSRHLQSLISMKMLRSALSF